MSKGDNSPGLSKLAGVLRGMAAGQVPTDLVLDFGEIQKDGSLITNTVPIAIPKGDYIICKHASISKGDRVLVAWVQNDAVIIDEI